MKLLGAEVVPVSLRVTARSKDAMRRSSQGIWVTNVEDTYYLIGTAAGPAPLSRACPRLFQSVIGRGTARADDGRPKGQVARTCLVAAGRWRIRMPSASFHPLSSTQSRREERSSASRRAARAYRAKRALRLADGGPARRCSHRQPAPICFRTRGRPDHGRPFLSPQGLGLSRHRPEHSWLKGESGRVEICADHG